ncbi:serine O-acetyltransferase [Suttonella sp. R2A3]|uniref:serine O-acetyltransferase n=1 Tax=Suttonella sp. R2A3 TaxID=2908648 RepID=UPI001F303A88|nr:serine O-acetyltransferase [Suttonella sp. R2A3]UJF25278.1 serine O-acetyltransferase [Suttonella sp. R2A3]
MIWFQRVKEDFAVVKERDPATKSSFAVLTLHTGFWAVASYRLQHALWVSGWRWLARLLANMSRWVTGVEIHPAVEAGHRLFIDHGMGIVIGETAELGDDVSIYQGVTLGGTSWAQHKRHPTIGSDVIIGAGAKVLGAITVADHARIGSNAVVVKDVPTRTTVVGIPAKAVSAANEHREPSHRHEDCDRFEAYAQSNDIADPVMTALSKLNDRICVLEEENERLKRQQRND